MTAKPEKRAGDFQDSSSLSCELFLALLISPARISTDQQVPLQFTSH